MSFSGDKEFGAIEFSKAISSGEGVTPNIALKQAYGLYLMHGGTPEGFMDLTPDDVQMMYTAYISTATYHRRELIKDIVKIVEAMYKG